VFCGAFHETFHEMPLKRLGTLIAVSGIVEVWLREKEASMTRSAMSVMSFSASSVWMQGVRSFRSLVKAVRDRREVMNLAEFDDRMLKDIGLTRSDVTSALAEPIHHNPSWVLVRCSGRPSRVELSVAHQRKSRPAVSLVRRVERCA
jgi:uncharacterized protein YjiS (DUF1127 family)